MRPLLTVVLPIFCSVVNQSVDPYGTVQCWTDEQRAVDEPAASGAGTLCVTT